MTRTMDAFVSGHAARLLRQVNRQVRRSLKHPDEKTIHDLRVSIRHLSQCLREFRQFFPTSKTKKRLKKLDKLMDRAAEIRNRDIAIVMIGGADPDLAAILQREREQAKDSLARSLHRWRRHD